MSTRPECVFVGGHAAGFDASCWWCVDLKRATAHGTEPHRQHVVEMTTGAVEYCPNGSGRDHLVNTEGDVLRCDETTDDFAGDCDR